MGKRLSENLGLKILSVFLAFFVWLAVVNISNPDDTGSQEVPLDILNGEILEASGKTYELLYDKETVTISYKVRTLNRSSIKASDFRAYIDLADMYEPTGAVPVKVEVLNNKNLISSATLTTRPGVIRVATEDLQRKTFNLTVKTEGKPEEGYYDGIPTTSPNYVYVSGPVSEMGRISMVGITVNMEGATADLSGTAELKCFDANKNEITVDDRVTFSRSEVDYTLPILKGKNLGLNFEVEGEVADGYRFTGIESNRNSVEVKGLKSDLAGVNVISIPKGELNIDGVSSDKEIVLDVNQYLPKGVELVHPEENEIKVVLKIEAMESRTYDLLAEQITLLGASAEYDYEYDRDKVSVFIRGLKEDLDQLTAEQLQAELDVSGMEPGEHEAAPVLTLGDAYELIRSGTIGVTVTEKGPSAAEETSAGSESQEAGDETEPTVKATTGA